jgi:uncharacterized protein YecT (DUF1311 family)
MKNWIFLILLVIHPVWAEEDLDCDKAVTTIEINYCLFKDLEASEKVMHEYLTKSIERHSDDNVAIESIHKAQEAWLRYREAHCGSVYDIWREGSIRTAMELGCKINLTHSRTKVLWESFLTYEDSTPPLLPEPEPYVPRRF